MANKNQFRIYVDEDSIQFGRHLKKEHGLNVVFPKNYGKSILDESQLRSANLRRAFILTKNEWDFKKIINKFDKIKEGGIIIWNTNSYEDICGYILCLCGWRSLALKGRVYVINREGIFAYSREGASLIKIEKPCELCQEKCANRDKPFLH